MTAAHYLTADRTGPVDLDISGPFTHITVVPGGTNRAEITLTTQDRERGPLSRAVREARLEDGGGRLSLHLPTPPAVNLGGNVHISNLNITGSSVNLIGNTVNGSVSIGTDGTQATDGVRAEIRLPQDSSLSVEAACGDCRIEHGQLQQVSFRSTSGGLTVRAKTEHLSFKSVSGSLKVAGSAEHVIARSVGGSLTILTLFGNAQLKTVDGSISVDVHSPGRVEAESISGDITVRDRSNLGNQLRVDARTVSGRFSNR